METSMSFQTASVSSEIAGPAQAAGSYSDWQLSFPRSVFWSQIWRTQISFAVCPGNNFSVGLHRR